MIIIKNLLINAAFMITMNTVCHGQRIVSDPTTGRLGWEEVYGDKILRYDQIIGKWSIIDSPYFTQMTPTEEGIIFWDGECLFRLTPSINDQASQSASVQIGTLQKSQNKNKPLDWDWSSPIMLPGKTLPLCAYKNKILVEIPIRSQDPKRPDRKRILAEVDFAGGKVIHLETIKLSDGQYFEINGISHEKDGYVFCNTGAIYKWANNGIVNMSKNFLAPLGNTIEPAKEDGMTPYPSFLCRPFLGIDGQIVIGVRYMSKTQNTSKPDIKESVRSTFIEFDPASGAISLIDATKNEHLYNRSEDGFTWNLRENIGPRLVMDPEGKIQSLNIDRVLSEAYTPPRKVRKKINLAQ